MGTEGISVATVAIGTQQPIAAFHARQVQLGELEGK